MQSSRADKWTALWCKLREGDSRPGSHPGCSSGGHSWPQDHRPWVMSQIPLLETGCIRDDYNRCANCLHLISVLMYDLTVLFIINSLFPLCFKVFFSLSSIALYKSQEQPYHDLYLPSLIRSFLLFMWREQGHQAVIMSKQTVISLCYFIVCQGSAVQSQQAYKAYVS